MGPQPRSPIILLVDGDVDGARSLAEGLEEAGFTTTHAGDGDAALAAFATGRIPDLVLLELLLPDQPGLEVCRRLREQSDVPIVVVTSLDSELDVAVALEVGADAYLVKPVEIREVVARARALLARSRDGERRRTTPAVLRVGDVRLDRSAHTVWVGERRVDLTLKEFGVLRILLERAGRVVPRHALLQEVWGQVPGESTPPQARAATLDAHMKRLRAKLEGGGAAASRITTFRKLGYRYETGAPG